MIYHTSWCPYCKYTLESHNSSYHYKVDSEYLPCPKCGKLYKTGKKLWNQMDSSEKTEYYFYKYIKAFFSALLMGFISSALLSQYLLKMDFNLISFLSCFTVFSFIAYFVTRNEINGEISVSFEDALLRHWKRYLPNCDSELKDANNNYRTKYNADFFELELSTLPKNLYENNKYRTINERIEYLNEYLYKEKDKEST